MQVVVSLLSFNLLPSLAPPLPPSPPLAPPPFPLPPLPRELVRVWSALSLCTIHGSVFQVDKVSSVVT